ncbi:uronate dehydrogenase protein (plasmid) [Rhizobium phaseoli]|uniref:NAD-dependent epimerase/dehydratase family protein n=1 Tax=Rhizobium phaseoli TaxID=396 RepID=UPI0007EB999E|nr:NAD(P)-dependent oxidoreductase [Rhizobium phaseoli]ANL51032.1 uronate dehydrogenase protein [Rhizobium phaseoli]
MKKLLITGAGGNVGRLLRPILRQRYNLKVTDVAEFQASSDETSIRGDLADPDFCRFAVDDVEAVIHLAGLVGPDIAFEQSLDPNYRAVLHLLEACKGAGIKRFVFASSHHVLGMYSATGRYDECAPAAPDSYYGLSKVFGEAACSMYAHRFGMNVMLLRIGNADPMVVDGRRERLWTSGRDMASLVEIGIEHPDIQCDIVYSISNCPDAIFDNRRAEELGYLPQDFAVENHSPSFVERSAPPPEAAGHVGGHFAVNELPVLSGRKS